MRRISMWYSIGNHSGKLSGKWWIVNKWSSNPYPWYRHYDLKCIPACQRAMKLNRQCCCRHNIASLCARNITVWVAKSVQVFRYFDAKLFNREYRVWFLFNISYPLETEYINNARLLIVNHLVLLGLFCHTCIRYISEPISSVGVLLLAIDSLQSLHS